MKYYKISNGPGYGKQRMTSFDAALLDAGVGNYNLVRLSSILPLDSHPQEEIHLPYGNLLPIAYAVESTNVPGRQISAAVAIGFPELDESEERCAVIMEYEGECPEETAVSIVTAMVCEGFKERGWRLASISVASDTVFGGDNGEWATAFACVAEWEE